MSFLRLLVETLWHYRLSNFAVLAGSAVGTTVLTGALLVGDSMRGTLRDLTLARLGRFDQALVGSNFFAADLGTRFDSDGKSPGESSAVILLQGSATGPKQSRASDVEIIGADATFTGKERAGKVLLNETLARQLRVEKGGRIGLNLASKESIPSEGLLGKRENTVAAIPLVVDEVIPDEGIGRFSLAISQKQPSIIIVPREKLGEQIKQPGRANALLVVDREKEGDSQRRLEQVVSLDDLGIEIEREPSWLSVGTREKIVSEEATKAIEQSAKALSLSMQPILTYLANGISANGKSIPYSVVSGVDVGSGAFSPGTLVAGVMPTRKGEMALNQWSVDRLGVKLGDTIKLSYFQVNADSSLKEVETSFTLVGIVPMSGWSIDKSFAPSYPGITDAETFADWEAPFPVELERVKDEDEKYWKDYRTAPKAFVSLAEGRELWSTRFGPLTSIRIKPGDGEVTEDFQHTFEKDLRDSMDLPTFGFTFLPVKKSALEASQGSTDFGMLFVSMSFFLIVSAALLVGLMFRLGTEARSSSIGLMLGIGFPVGRVRGLLAVEGAILAILGGLIGCVGAVGFARLLVSLLTTWWRDAVGTSFIEYHAQPMSFVIGWLASVVIAILAIVWAVRRVSSAPVPVLLSTGFATSGGSTTRSWISPSLAALGLVSGVGLIGWGLMDPSAIVGAFFGGAAMLLLGGLSAFSAWLTPARFLHSKMNSNVAPSLVEGTGLVGLVKLGVRNSSRYPARSVVTVALLALAVFLVVAVGGMRHASPEEKPTKESGNGGFSLLAQASTALPRDLADPSARLALNVSDEAGKILDESEVFGFRVQAGDDASCLNVFQPRNPTLVGVPKAFVDRGGFAFASSLARTPEEKENPWRLLELTSDDGSIPAIGDAATLQWILKVPIGSSLTMKAEDGREVPIRIVGGLSGSIFQGQLLVAESALLKRYPSVTGRKLFAIAPSPEKQDRLMSLLESDLAEYGFDVQTTAEVLRAYLAVQSTYMASFETLGGLGVILGTLGLGAVLLRSVLERRGELALLRAIGFTSGSIGVLVMAETVFLLVMGMLIGVGCAAVAISPQLIGIKNWGSLESLGGVLGGVFLAGLVSGIVAVVAALRTPILEALRSERG